MKISTTVSTILQKIEIGTIRNVFVSVSMLVVVKTLTV